jgi:hypothetical protein
VVHGSRGSSLYADHVDVGTCVGHSLPRFGELDLLGAGRGEQDRDLTATEGLISHDISSREYSHQWRCRLPVGSRVNHPGPQCRANRTVTHVSRGQETALIWSASSRTTHRP